MAALALFGGMGAGHSLNIGGEKIAPAVQQVAPAVTRKESPSAGASTELNNTISDEVAASLGYLHERAKRGGMTPKRWGMSDVCYRMVRGNKFRAHRAGRSTAKFQLAH